MMKVNEKFVLYKKGKPLLITIQLKTYHYLFKVSIAHTWLYIGITEEFWKH